MADSSAQNMSSRLTLILCRPMTNDRLTIRDSRYPMDLIFPKCANGSRSRLLGDNARRQSKPGCRRSGSGFARAGRYIPPLIIVSFDSLSQYDGRLPAFSGWRYWDFYGWPGNTAAHGSVPQREGKYLMGR
jgi:hypothetical protein